MPNQSIPSNSANEERITPTYSLFIKGYSKPRKQGAGREEILAELHNEARRARTESARQWAAQCPHALTCGKGNEETPKKCWASRAYSAVKDGNRVKDAAGKVVKNWGWPDGWTCTGLWTRRMWDLENPNGGDDIPVPTNTQTPNWAQPSGDVLLDADHVAPMHLDKVVETLAQMPGCWLTHITYSGAAVRAVISVSPMPRTQDEHKQAEAQVRATADDWLRPYGVKCDQSTNDPTRYSFLNYAPDAAMHSGNGVFEWTPAEHPSEGEEAGEDAPNAARRGAALGEVDLGEMEDAYAYLIRGRDVPYSDGKNADGYIQFIGLGKRAGLSRAAIEAATALGKRFNPKDPDELCNWPDIRFSKLGEGKRDIAIKTIFRLAYDAGWSRVGRPRKSTPSEKTLANQSSAARAAAHRQAAEFNLPQAHRFDALEGQGVERIIRYRKQAEQHQGRVAVGDAAAGFWHLMPRLGLPSQEVQGIVRKMLEGACADAADDVDKWAAARGDEEALEYALEFRRAMSMPPTAHAVQQTCIHLAQRVRDLPLFGKPYDYAARPLMPVEGGGAWDVRAGEMIQAPDLLSRKMFGLGWVMPAPDLEAHKSGEGKRLMDAVIEHYGIDQLRRIAFLFTGVFKTIDVIKAPVSGFGKSLLLRLQVNAFGAGAVVVLEADNLTLRQFSPLKVALAHAAMVWIDEADKAEQRGIGVLNGLVGPMVEPEVKGVQVEPAPRTANLGATGNDWINIPTDDNGTINRLEWARNYASAGEMDAKLGAALWAESSGVYMQALLLELAAELWADGKSAERLQADFKANKANAAASLHDARATPGVLAVKAAFAGSANKTDFIPTEEIYGALRDDGLEDEDMPSAQDLGKWVALAALPHGPEPARRRVGGKKMRGWTNLVRREEAADASPAPTAYVPAAPVKEAQVEEARADGAKCHLCERDLTDALRMLVDGKWRCSDVRNCGARVAAQSGAAD